MEVGPTCGTLGSLSFAALGFFLRDLGFSWFTVTGLGFSAVPAWQRKYEETHSAQVFRKAREGTPEGAESPERSDEATVQLSYCSPGQHQIALQAGCSHALLQRAKSSNQEEGRDVP